MTSVLTKCHLVLSQIFVIWYDDWDLVLHCLNGLHKFLLALTFLIKSSTE